MLSVLSSIKCQLFWLLKLIECFKVHMERCWRLVITISRVALDNPMTGIISSVTVLQVILSRRLRPNRTRCNEKVQSASGPKQTWLCYSRKLAPASWSCPCFSKWGAGILGIAASRENFICRGAPPPSPPLLWDTSYGIHIGSTPPWRFWDTVQQIQQAHRFVNTSDASNSVAKSSHASLIIGDFNSKVGCVIAVCVSYMFTTFYLMSICLTPLDVPPVRMHPC